MPALDPTTADEPGVAGTVAEEGASLMAKNPNLGEVAVRGGEERVADVRGVPLGERVPRRGAARQRGGFQHRGLAARGEVTATTLACELPVSRQAVRFGSTWRCRTPPGRSQAIRSGVKCAVRCGSPH